MTTRTVSRAGASIALAAVLAVVTAASVVGCAPTPNPIGPSEAANPAISPVSRASLAPAVRREMAYAARYWKHRNVERFGDLKGTDCVNFVSQALLARGWKMTPQWNHSFLMTVNEYSPAWISSTAFMHYLAEHPKLATPLSWSQRGKVAVGDVVQFDYDDSGNRDHTAIVSRITGTGNDVVIDVAQHSGGALYRPLSSLLAAHTSAAKVYFWHISG
jgi:hypothetical protein